MFPFMTIFQELQEIDTRRIALQSQLKMYPEKLAALDADLATAQQALDALAQEQNTSAREKRQLEQTVADLEERIRRYEAQESVITSEKELQALEHEISALHKKIEPLEERQIEILVRADELDTAIPQAEKNLQEAQARVDREKARIAEQIQTKREELGMLKQTWDTLGARLDAGQKRDFEALARRYPGSVITTAIQGVCQGCHTEIIPNTLVTLRKGEEPVRCPQCDRFLYASEPPSA